MNSKLRSCGVTAGAILCAALAGTACRSSAPDGTLRASGYVEATEVRISAEVGGRLLELFVSEGDRIEKGTPIARIDPTDIELTLARSRAEREQADAQLRLLLAGSRQEDIRQALAVAEAAEAETAAARQELEAAERDLATFESLLASSSGSRKQRDDAVTRRNVAREMLRAVEQRKLGASEALARLRAGSRPEEIEAARARVAAADAQLAILQKNLQDTTILSPVAGSVTLKLIDQGELVAPRTPLLVVTDLDRAWANLYIDEPMVPRLRLGQPATIRTDHGDELPGTITFVSPKAEFTPRNVQTAAERSKLVFRIKVSVDNRGGILKVGMPVEADIPVGPADGSGDGRAEGAIR
jgi:HlyD family secretion protein